MIERELRAFARAHDLTGDRLLLAVSGGRDSVVLLDGFVRIAPEFHLDLVVGHVDHRLRGPAISAEDRDFVAALAGRNGLAFVSRGVDPEREREGGNSRARPSLEEAARTLRYAALSAMADEVGADWIATAHHLGDQAETVLLRVLRGTGSDGLAAMPPVDERRRLVRPLLSVPPEAVAEAARDRALPFREDASNADRRFARNRLRLDWLPGLAREFNPQLLRKLGDLSEASRRDLEWIEVLVEEAAEKRLEVGPDGVRIAIDGWAELPEALARRLVRAGLRRAGLERDVTRSHIERVLAFLRRGRNAGRDRRLELPAGRVLRRVDDAFLLEGGAGAEKIGERGDATVPRRE